MAKAETVTACASCSPGRVGFRIASGGFGYRRYLQVQCMIRPLRFSIRFRFDVRLRSRFDFRSGFRIWQSTRKGLVSAESIASRSDPILRTIQGTLECFIRCQISRAHEHSLVSLDAKFFT